MGTIGDLGCFSISAYKIVGGGEGGLIITDRELLHDRAQVVAETGGLWRPVRFAPPRYDGELFCGTNYRLSEMEAAVDTVQLRKLDQVVERFRGVKLSVLRRLRTFREITPQRLNDPEGEVGYSLRFFPETVELSEQIAEALRAEGLDCHTRGRNAEPDWHLYSYMFPVTGKRGPTEVNCPFECPIYRQAGGHVAYNRGDCPVADDLFERAVGVSLNQWFTEQDCAAIAEGINKVLSAYCTEDAEATPWL